MAVELPALEIIALNRMAFGPRPGDLERVRGMGLEAYVDEQLNPVDGDDAAADAKIASTTLNIAYQAGPGWDALDEDRALVNLDIPIESLWDLQKPEPPRAFAEQIRPAMEVFIATLIRAAHSKWQLREVMADFWHNHFNVNFNQDVQIAVGLPIYDRDVMRKHCFGNFRAMIEDMTKSVSMAHYLNNVSNKNAPANENFARELMELHTLGAETYFNDRYDTWDKVPGALEGEAIGFIDDDVRAVARILTGWTIENGSSRFQFNLPPDITVEDTPSSGAAKKGNAKTAKITRTESAIKTAFDSVMPSTGRFHFFSPWHDYNEKRFLGESFPAGVGVKEGRRMLDKLARHPATARFIAKKLVRRFVADDPPQAVVDAAAATFMANVDAPDQIAKTLRTILLSTEFATTWGAKVKRPLEYITSFVRALGGDFTPNRIVFYLLNATGQTLFQYPAPTGHPDVMPQWTSSNVLLTNWRIVTSLAHNWWKTDSPAIIDQIPQDQRNGTGVVNFLAQRMFGYPPSEATANGLATLAAQIEAENLSWEEDDPSTIFVVQRAAATIGIMPEFHQR